MFGFLQRSQVHGPSPALRHALAAHGLPPGMPPESLSVVESRGQYAGRGVTYLQVFDAVRAAERGVAVHRSADLEPYPDLVLATGRLESDGSVVLNEVQGGSVPAPTRVRADRAVHGDDERFVFPDQPTA